jgi:CHAT domain-containing protein
MLVRIAATGIAAICATSALAVQRPISVRDTFPVGTGSETVCSAQVVTRDPALVDMFDRGFSILCRDASAPVGHVYALRSRRGDPAARLASLRAARATCEAEEAAQLEALPGTRLTKCRLKDSDLAYRVYTLRRGAILYVAEGLAGYDSALQLALRSVHADRPVEGQVQVATTGAGDALSFARLQAGNTSRARLLAEAYRRNSAGNYAEAAEFFAALTPDESGGPGRAEALTNQALQKSNLGAFAEAEELFDAAARVAGSDPVIQRQLRNQRVMHLLNRNRLTAALAELDKPIVAREAPQGGGLAALVIDSETAAALNSQGSNAQSLGGFDELSPQDRMRVLDGQAMQLRGSVLRLQGRLPEATAAFTRAGAELAAVRGGRVAAALWMRAQILSELASVAEAQRNLPDAGRHHQEAIQLFERDNPGSPAWSNATGRYAAFLGRTGRGPEALTLFRAIVDANASAGTPSPALRRHLRSYFQLLLAGSPSPEAAGELFRASQLLTRPGIAQTQAVLARELSAGSDDAARLFRQSLNQSREVERAVVALNALRAEPEVPPARIAFAEAQLARLRQEQVATQARLAEFPQFRALSSGLMTAQEMQALLGPGEAYYKMIVLDEDSYALLVTPDVVRAVPVAITERQLDERVTGLRTSIASLEDGQTVTYAFDLEVAHQLYTDFFSPFREHLAGVRHLIFEPDGAMLRLPANVLVEDAASVAAYKQRAERNEEDAFNFSGVAWLGRQREISTAISPRAFRDVRRVPPSQARLNYIGFGENAPLDPAALERAATRSAAAGDGCSWSPTAWNRPISAQELLLARGVFSASAPGSAEVIVGAAFTDEQIEARTDLTDYRIVHFATHGLLMPPRPECPARPSLMTSFGGEASDGLLSFGEIFNLKLDADIVILSACDTAGQASLAANREAGITNGGSFTFDGLVRAFVGAGGRLVLASHWPLPDQFDATQRLISGLLSAPPGTSTGAALLNAQRGLMDTPETSHPFYWAAFAIVGDAKMPVFRTPVRTAATAQ